MHFFKAFFYSLQSESESEAEGWLKGKSGIPPNNSIAKGLRTMFLKGSCNHSSTLIIGLLF